MQFSLKVWPEPSATARGKLVDGEATELSVENIYACVAICPAGLPGRVAGRMLSYARN